jgi:hypothetical protein
VLHSAGKANTCSVRHVQHYEAPIAELKFFEQDIEGINGLREALEKIQ